MNFYSVFSLSITLVFMACQNQAETHTEISQSVQETQNMTVYDIPVNLISGEKLNWDNYKGKRIMFVNVASACGLTPQYEKLQAIYEDLDKSKYAIIGVPANNFLKQEPGTADDIAAFCKKNYGVEFPILEKMSVGSYVYLEYPASKDNAESTEVSPLYAYLTNINLNGHLDIDVTWNFQKIFVDEKGQVYDYAEPREIDVETLLTKLAS